MANWKLMLFYSVVNEKYNVFYKLRVELDENKELSSVQSVTLI